jgi:carbonic anhydrase
MLALLVQVGKTPNPEFDTIAQMLKSVRYKGQQVRVRHVSVQGLLPATDYYITYEGSLTQPGCQETVTWIIINKPLYISQDNLKAMREVMQGDVSNPKLTMGINYRPVMQTHQRTVRTNINFHNPTEKCSMERQVFYQANVLDKS